MTGIPPGFDREFLEWFRRQTERAWAEHEARRFEDYAEAQVGGLDFQRGTRWRGGLTDAAIDAVERREGIRFPPDHRLFLRVLHATDRPMTGALFSRDGLAPVQAPGVYDWENDGDAIHRAIGGVLHGLVFDVERNGLWPASWGPRSDTESARRARIAELLAAAPPALPIFSHRFVLVADPARAGNPVISIHQSDIIVYGATLREYLLNEFAKLIGLSRPFYGGEAVTEGIPFWGELIEN